MACESDLETNSSRRMMIPRCIMVLFGSAVHLLLEHFIKLFGKGKPALRLQILLRYERRLHPGEIDRPYSYYLQNPGGLSKNLLRFQELKVVVLNFKITLTLNYTFMSTLIYSII